ncbi:MAG: carboxylating nicotinate-nucleotide diphosphorylase [Gammaproteobacteria bacterium]|nr:carboxylating nicotinate-nucleotide diphosphorylase [Gammaproteobacteria bacterium]
MPVATSTITANVEAALLEDVGSGDLTAALVPTSASARAKVVCREAAIICGIDWFSQVYQQLHFDGSIDWQVKDSDDVPAETIICHISGNARILLTGERTALNFLQTLSGTATRTKQYVDAVAGTNTKILDTRKTLPGLREAQKYAVHCGGGRNHRMGLYDGILIKENHIRAAGGVTQAYQNAVSLASGISLLEIEVETLPELEQALEAGAKRILLDNFSLAELETAVNLSRGKAELEASGGVSLANIRAIAETGVDYISVGDITKNIRAVDLSMQFETQ